LHFLQVLVKFGLENASVILQGVLAEHHKARSFAVIRPGLFQKLSSNFVVSKEDEKRATGLGAENRAILLVPVLEEKPDVGLFGGWDVSDERQARWAGWD
jgi:hypothetical protein